MGDVNLERQNLNLNVAYMVYANDGEVVVQSGAAQYENWSAPMAGQDATSLVLSFAFVVFLLNLI